MTHVLSQKTDDKVDFTYRIATYMKTTANKLLILYIWVWPASYLKEENLTLHSYAQTVQYSAT